MSKVENKEDVCKIRSNLSRFFLSMPFLEKEIIFRSNNFHSCFLVLLWQKRCYTLLTRNETDEWWGVFAFFKPFPLCLELNRSPRDRRPLTKKFTTTIQSPFNSQHFAFGTPSANKKKWIGWSSSNNKGFGCDYMSFLAHLVRWLIEKIFYFSWYWYRCCYS